LALVLAMYESARTGAPVTLTDGIWEKWVTGGATRAVDGTVGAVHEPPLRPT
jgi:hypothetical protein